ncbi:MAG: hypothetical protein P4M05_02845 [Bradyrhizobium sp.]|nr:hypothetical protein [Bradyrhizobium sp.]
MIDVAPMPAPHFRESNNLMDQALAGAALRVNFDYVLASQTL